MGCQSRAVVGLELRAIENFIASEIGHHLGDTAGRDSPAKSSGRYELMGGGNLRGPAPRADNSLVPVPEAALFGTNQAKARGGPHAKFDRPQQLRDSGEELGVIN
jgi:hypothetical protein